MNIDKTKYQIFPKGKQVDMEIITSNYNLKVEQDKLNDVKLYRCQDKYP